MQGFRILKKIAGKQWDNLTSGRPDPASTADRDLPLGLRLNGLVDVDETDFILAGQELLTRHPGERLIVRAIGRAELWGAIRLYRFYLQRAESEAMLQVACDRQGQVEEIHLFRTFDEVYPASADDWLAGATSVPGSWWPDWADWLAQHAGKKKAAPKAYGNRQHKVIEPAPGRYVKQKV